MKRVKRAWESAGDSVKMYFNPNLSQQESDRLLVQMGDWFIRAEAAVLDGPVVVVNAGMRMVSADKYRSFASSGGVALTDQNWAVQRAKGAGLGDFISAFMRPQSDWLTSTPGKTLSARSPCTSAGGVLATRICSS